ncbi:MAG: hypothetical protein IT236_03345 [Bacteroidia bacterium]|nr:hypothetical protein [Bacteroidia bacterium]
MNSICFFASYFEGEKLPYYVLVYLNELKGHYPNLVFLTGNTQLSSGEIQDLKDNGIGCEVTTNKGFDFGLWYYAFQKYPPANYDQIILVNDSCVLFKSLSDFVKWSEFNTAEMQGMTLSEAVSTHIQSYFLVIKKAAITTVSDYFSKHKIYTNISDVISNYEIGLSKHLIQSGYKLAAFIDNNGYNGEFSPYYQCINYHLEKGIPVIKKKILFSSYRKEERFTLARMNFDISPNAYISKIKQLNTGLILDFEILMSENRSQMSTWDKLNYFFMAKSIAVFRYVRNVFKHA